jgi:hypothetical protein
MGIDGIGKPPSPPNIGELTSLESAEVRLEPARATRSDAPSAIGASDTGLLSQLEQGQITREQYLDRRIDEAVSPFASRLSPDQLEHVRSTLREQLQIDPAIVDLIRRATENAEA